MSRPKDQRKNVDAARSAPPLANPFAVLGELDALKNLAPPPEPKREQAKPRPTVVAATAAPPKPVKSRGRLILRRETKSRGGKTVVVIYGFNEVPGANAVMIADLAKDLKGKLGVGGSFDRQEIVLQGDRCADVTALLEQLGFRVDGVRS